MRIEELKIPRYLDEPERFFIFTKGEILLLTVPALIGYINFKAIGILCGLAFGITAVKYKSGFVMRHGKFYLLGLMYWNLPQRFLIYNLYKAFPKTEVREYIG